MAKHKDKIDILMKSINTYDTKLAETVLSPGYVQHNPNIPDGRDGILSLYPVLASTNIQVNTLRLLEDQNYLVAHNFWSNAEAIGAKEVVTFDFFRMEADGSIGAHWDVIMPNTPANGSGRTLTDGETEITDLDKTEENKTLVKNMFSDLISAEPAQVPDILAKYFQVDYKQHNPDATDGISGFLNAVQSGQLNFTFKKQHLVIGEGNFVLSISEGEHRGNHAAFYDLVRIESGKIAEHWDVIQDIPEKSVHGNSMFGF